MSGSRQVPDDELGALTPLGMAVQVEITQRRIADALEKANELKADELAQRADASNRSLNWLENIMHAIAGSGR